MQFNIRDLLFVTSVVVLVVVACIRYRAADRIDSQVTKARFEVKSLQDSIVRSKQYLPNYEPRMDYVGQIQQAHGAAAADFDNVRKRYSKIEPKPGKVVAREIPEYGDLNPKHLRLHIPQEYPVYLRSAIKAKQDSSSDDSSKIEKALDQVAWQTETPFSDPSPHEIRLDPGWVDLWFYSGHKQPVAELRIGETHILRTTFLGESSYPFPSGLYCEKPIEIDLTESTRKIRMIDFGDFEVWIWLSSQSEVTGFTPFPKMQKSTEGKDLE